MFDRKIPGDFLFSAKASKPAEPIVVEFSLLGFHVFDSFVVGSGPSGIVSWTMPRSSDSRPVSEAILRREVRDCVLPDRLIIASMLSLLSSSLGVWIEEKLDAVIVGDNAGRLDLVVREPSLYLFDDLSRVTRSEASWASSVVMVMWIGGERLLCWGDDAGGCSGDSAKEDEGGLWGSTEESGGDEAVVASKMLCSSVLVAESDWSRRAGPSESGVTLFELIGSTSPPCFTSCAS